MNHDKYYEYIEEYIISNRPNCILGPMDLTPVKRYVEKQIEADEENSFDIGVYMDCFEKVFTKTGLIQWKFTSRGKYQHVEADIDELAESLQSTLTIQTVEAIRPDEDKRLNDLLELIKKNRPQNHKTQ